MKIWLSSLLFFVIFLASSDALNDLQSCIKNLRGKVDGKNTTKAIAGLTGIGWDDLTNSYTLPILETSFKKCLTDNNNQYFIPDNAWVIPVEISNVEKSSKVVEDFKSMMESSSNKISVGGSATVKGVTAGGSFSKENQQSKEAFEKQTSIMFLNTITYSAFEILVDEHKGFDKYFLERLYDIADAVKEKKMIWGKYLAEVFINDFGTHVVNRATAGAEIRQETYIDKTETYKGEKKMDAIKTEVNIGFKNIAKVSIGYERSSEEKKSKSVSNVTNSSILKTRGGPDIERVLPANQNESMLYVENLVGIKQSGKYIYDIIGAVEFSNHTEHIKYVVRELLENATYDYYKFNHRPGCMNVDSENFNRIANEDDDSCMDPKYLFAFSGIFQTCQVVSATSETGEKIQWDFERCIEIEKTSLYKRRIECPDGISPQQVFAYTHFFKDRKAKVTREKCGLFWFIFGCSKEEVEVPVIDEFFFKVYWCPTQVTISQADKDKDRPKNKLNEIMNHKVLRNLDDAPDLLKIQFPGYTDPFEAAQAACLIDPHPIFNATKPFGVRNPEMEANSTKLLPLVKYYDLLGRGYSLKDSDTVDTREYNIRWHNSTWDTYETRHTYYINYKPQHMLDIREDQLEMLKYYPTLLQRLIPILQIPLHLRLNRKLHPVFAKHPIILQSILFEDTSTIYDKEPQQVLYFGGGFKKGTLNPFTGTYDCPPNFKPMTILLDFVLCLSSDPPKKWPLRLGGFFGCNSDLKLCPLGYSEYLGTVIGECEYYYCIRFHSRDYIATPVLNRPPYTDYALADAESMLDDE